MIEQSRHRILFIPKKGRENINKTLKRKRRSSSQSYLGLGVDYIGGMY